MRTERGPSRTEDLTAVVRDAIVTAELAPGERLVESRLAERYGVSRIPVREVLRQLASEGFVELAPNRGAVVASPSPAEAASLLEVREVLEVLIAERAARHRTAAHVVELRAVLGDADAARAGRGSRAARRSQLVVLNSRFHDTLGAAAANPVAGQLLAQLRSKIQWVYSMRVDDRAEASWAEHAAIVDAVEARAPARAARLARQHLANARAAYVPAGGSSS